MDKVHELETKIAGRLEIRISLKKTTFWNGESSEPRLYVELLYGGRVISDDYVDVEDILNSRTA